MGSPLPDQLKRDTDALIFDGKVVLVANKPIIKQHIKYWEVIQHRIQHRSC